jgi:hypothetical protein
LKEQRQGRKRRKRRKKGSPLAMDRIVLNQKVEVGKDVLIQGPPLEALGFQGCRVGSLVTLTDPEGNDFRGEFFVSPKPKSFFFDAFHHPRIVFEIILLRPSRRKEWS